MVLVGLPIVTFALVILGMISAGTSDGFFFMVLVIDLPAVAILFVVDGAERNPA